jgi:outer membrane immunogenic protein
VLKRLAALERENSVLRDRVRRLETHRGSNAQNTAATQSKTVTNSRDPQSAYAAAYKAMPAVATPFSWTGFYVGGHVGWGWDVHTVNDPFSIFTLNGTVTGESVRAINANGFLGGAQAGWNYQIGNLVVGTEVSLSAADIKGSRTDTLSATTPTGFLTGTTNISRTWNNRVDWLGTATTRFGYAWDRWLVYTKGGVAVSRNHYSLRDVTSSTSTFTAIFPPTTTTTTATTTIAQSGTDTRVGWIVGAGFEWAFWNGWSASLEYNYMDFGNRPVTVAGTTNSVIVTTGVPGSTTTSVGSATTVGMEQYVQTVKLGVNHRFGAPP